MEGRSFLRTLAHGRILWPALLLALAALPTALADHVGPEAVPGGENLDCDDLTPEGEEWSQLKIDPPADGSFEGDGIVITVDVDDIDKVFDWSADSASVGFVFVKAGSGGSHLYTYDPLEDADTGLTSPGAGDKNQISHITFCYQVPDAPPNCEETPDAEGCAPNCEETPDAEGCAPNCEETPDAEGCTPNCEEQPDHDECGPTCEDQPDMEGCEPAVTCPTDLLATARDDASIELAFTPAEGSDGTNVYVAEGDDEFALAATLDADETGWTDTAAVAGNTYRYMVTGLFGDVESEDCPVAEATSIPDFPTMLAAGGAVSAGVLAYAFARRKR